MKTTLIWIAAAIVPFGFVVLALAAAGGYVAIRVPGRSRAVQAPVGP